MNKKMDFSIPSLGVAKISSPIIMSSTQNDGQADYVDDSDHILYGIDTDIDRLCFWSVGMNTLK
jgi:6-phosphofructokinase 1